MKIKNFVKNFDFENPDWSGLPEGFPNCELGDLTNNEIGQFGAIKTLWEMSRPEKIESRSRVWEDPKGYQYLAVWQNAALLRVLVRKFTSTLPLMSNKGRFKGELKVAKDQLGTLKPTLNKPLEYRLKAQMDDAARSVKRNIEEGWKRPTTSEYLQFLGYSQASLEEVKGDVRDCKTDGFLLSKPLSTLKDLGIDLRVTKGPGKGQAKGEPTDPGHPYYQPLKTLQPETLSYEEFMELVNKTDWLLRKLVESLEKKLEDGQMYWQVEQARIASNLKMR